MAYSFPMDCLGSLPAGIREIFSKAKEEERWTLFDAISTNEKRFWRMATEIMSRPSTLALTRKELLIQSFTPTEGWNVEFNRMSGGILIGFPKRTSRVTGLSIIDNRYGGCELALLDGGRLRYIHSIGYGDIRYCDEDELIGEVQRIFSGLQRIQHAHNKKRRQRRKNRKTRNL